MTEPWDKKIVDGRRSFFADTMRRVSDKAADTILSKLHSASETWGEAFVPGQDQADSGDSWSEQFWSGAAFDRPYFRPPGAVREAEFVEMCSTCRKCVDICPAYCIVPAQSHMGAPLGTPIMFPNDAPCTLCGKCMDVCPSGALLPIPTEFVRIGVAHIIEQTCLAYADQHCTKCHDACPVTPNAVRFPEEFHGTSPWIDPKLCTGCGLCVHPCPTQPYSIEVRLRPYELDVALDDLSDGEQPA